MNGSGARSARSDVGTGALAALAALAWAGAAAPQEEPAAPISLSAAQPSATSHRANESFTYALELDAGRDYLISVEQQGFDLVLTLRSPDGTVQAFDSPLLRDEREIVLLEEAQRGRYLVEVRTDEHTGAVGGHSVGFAEIAGDDAMLQAWRLMTAAAAANAIGGEDAWEKAAQAYESAERQWAALGRDRERAHALYAAAAVRYWQLYDWPESAELASAAAGVYDRLGEAALAANALHLQAAALVEQALEARAAAGAGEPPSIDALTDAALDLLERASGTHERLGNLHDLGLVVNNIGYTHYNLGNFSEAARHWERATTIMRSADEWAGELNAVSNLAALDAEAGNVTAAVDAFERVLELLPEGELPRYRADTLDNLGISLLMLGNAEQSLEAFASALSIQSDIADLQGRGRSLRGIGRAYYGLGRLDLAKVYLEEASALARDTRDGRNEEAILRDLGNVAYLEQDYESALALHRRALEIVASRSDRVYLELLIARDLIALGRPDEARDIAETARTAAEGFGSALLQAEALHQSGRARLQDSLEDGIALLERAAAGYERLGLDAQHAEVLHGLALGAERLGRLEEAVAYGDASLRQLEALRLRVASPELRAFFAAIRGDFYETQIRLLTALEGRASGRDGAHARTALETSERARARMIADLLQEASIDVRYDADAALLARRSELYAQLAERSQRRERLLATELEPARDEQLRALNAGIASIENELNLLEIRLRNESPRFASLSPATPLDVDGMQALLDEDTVLLQYVVGERASFVWAVTRDAVTLVELADRQTLEDAARRVLARFEAHRPDRDARLALEADLRSLSALVLAPVAERLSRRRVVLSLDGVLQYVPFAALPIPSPDGANLPLLATHQVVQVPSMTALAALRERRRPARAPRTLAVFADPVLDATDPRLASRPSAPNSARDAAEPLLALRTSGDPPLGRLPSTAFEADSIAALVPPEQRLVAKGFDASREAVLGADLADYRYIHFATHGLVDSRHPALSAMALARFDENGDSREGLLRLNDVYGLALDADLVVLSACETALGREVRGEGLLGLGQGFMYAGARSLIASLWRVPDRATSELMVKLYAFMLEEGVEPAEALRRAQLAIANDRRWSDPYFWSGFVMIGDWQ